MNYFVAIGTSLGGLRACSAVLGKLPADLPAAIALVQHRAEAGTEDLVAALQRECLLPVLEAEDKQPIASSRVYVAPAGYHLLVDEEGFALSVDPPVNWARPSVDVLFESAAQTFGERTIAVVLSGASRDGVAGALAVRAAHGTIVVQDPATAESPVMPGAVVAALAVDAVLPLSRISDWLLTRIAGDGDALAPAGSS